MLILDHGRLMFLNYTSIEEFTVKSAYHMGIAYMARKVYGVGNEGTSMGGTGTLWKKIWGLNTPTPIKGQATIWRMCQIILPTMDNLAIRAINVQSECAWCGLEEESAFPYDFLMQES